MAIPNPQSYRHLSCPSRKNNSFFSPPFQPSIHHPRHFNDFRGLGFTIIHLKNEKKQQ